MEGSKDISEHGLIPNEPTLLDDIYEVLPMLTDELNIFDVITMKEVNGKPNYKMACLVYWTIAFSIWAWYVVIKDSICPKDDKEKES